MKTFWEVTVFAVGAIAVLVFCASVVLWALSEPESLFFIPSVESFADFWWWRLSLVFWALVLLMIPLSKIMERERRE